MPHLDSWKRASNLFCCCLKCFPSCLPAVFLLCCSYSLHNKDYQWFHAQDQTQTAVINLLNLAASAIALSKGMQRHCARHTGLAVCKLYKDPFQIWVSGSDVGDWQ